MNSSHRILYQETLPLLLLVVVVVVVVAVVLLLLLQELPGASNRGSGRGVSILISSVRRQSMSCTVQESY